MLRHDLSNGAGLLREPMVAVWLFGEEAGIDRQCHAGDVARLV
jgi:hypothetical protein